MALKKCKECGVKVSTRAATCPSCGAPVKAKGSTVSTGCGCLVLVVIVVICAGIFSSSSDPPNPNVPLTPAEQAAHDAQEKADDERRAADRETAQATQKENLDTFMATLKAVGVDNSIIDSVSVKGDTVTITVANTWHIMAYQIRLQSAQNLWQAWATIASPKEPDHARLKLVDLNGNEVGGSRILAGSLIWVQEK